MKIKIQRDWVKSPSQYIVYVTYQWVGSNSWWPSEWVMSAMSCPQQPCSVPVESCLWLFLWSQPIFYLVFPFSCCLLFFQHYCLFQRNLPWCAQNKTTLVLSFLPPGIVQAYLFSDPLVLLSGAQGICQAFPQHQVLTQLWMSQFSMKQIKPIY